MLLATSCAACSAPGDVLFRDVSRAPPPAEEATIEAIAQDRRFAEWVIYQAWACDEWGCIQRRAVEMKSRGLSHRAAAEAMGISPSSYRRLLERAEKYEAATEGQRAAVDASGLDMGVARHGWRVIPREDGGRDSVFWVADQGDNAEDLAARWHELLSDLPAAAPIRAPEETSSSLIALLPVADLHVGMMAWGQETGEDWNTRKAADRLVKWIGEVVSAIPICSEIVVLFNGDTIHANDQKNVTPANKHTLDVDTRHLKTLDMALQAIVTSIDLARQHADKVRVVIKPGNHDPEGYMALLVGVRAHYRQEPRVEVEAGATEFWAFRFGRVMLMSHHGHRAKPQELVLGLAHEFAAMWGQTEYRYLWTGHLHHLKSADIGGVQWEQSRAVTARDAFAASHPYPARSELQGIVYHCDRGEIMRVRVAR